MSDWIEEIITDFWESSNGDVSDYKLSQAIRKGIAERLPERNRLPLVLQNNEFTGLCNEVRNETLQQVRKALLGE